jgi:hypothetical protein
VSAEERPSPAAIRNAFREEILTALADMEEDPDFVQAVSELLGPDEPLPPLLAAGVSVPTEPGAPDPFECAVCGEHPVGSFLLCGVHGRYGGAALASQPVPAPEPSARRCDFDCRYCNAAQGYPTLDASPEPSARLREALVQTRDYLASGSGVVGVIAFIDLALAATPQDPEETR